MAAAEIEQRRRIATRAPTAADAAAAPLLLMLRAAVPPPLSSNLPPPPPSTHDTTTDAALEDFALECLALVTPHVETFMWQRDAFTLTPSTREPPPWTTTTAAASTSAHDKQKSSSSRRAGGGGGSGSNNSGSNSGSGTGAPAPPPCLWGVLSFGDAVDDEWFAAWLLLELTRRVEGASARVWDDDGEFLLIEAAYSLPRWLKPEVGAGRVWLHGGRVHVVPLPSARHPSLPPSPTTAEALAIVRAEGVDTVLPR